MNYRLIGLSGSLRQASTNTALLLAAQSLAPAGLEVQVYAGLGQLALFNPDLDADPPVPVRHFRDALASADGVVIASPEYAHGVSGTIKNALDWAVSWEEFYGKPVALFNASPRATHALAALRETLETMSAWIIEPACIAVPVLSKAPSADQLIADALIADPLRAALQAFVAALEHGRPEQWGRNA